MRIAKQAAVTVFLHPLIRAHGCISRPVMHAGTNFRLEKLALVTAVESAHVALDDVLSGVEVQVSLTTSPLLA